MQPRPSFGIRIIATLFFTTLTANQLLSQVSKSKAKAKFEDGFNSYLTVELDMGKYLSYCTFETDESGMVDRIGEGRFVHARKLIDENENFITSPLDRYRFARREWHQFKPNRHEFKFFLLRQLPKHRYIILGGGPPEPCNVIDNPFPKDLPPPRMEDVSHDEFLDWKQRAQEASNESLDFNFLDRALYLPIIPFGSRHKSYNEFKEIAEVYLSDENFQWVDFGYDNQKNRYWGVAHFTVDGDNPNTELVIDLDPDQGMRPVEYAFRRLLPSGIDQGDKIFIRAKTDWEQYGEFWLPKQVLLVDRSRGPESEVTEIDKIEWWVGDDVPDEIFELKDFSKSCHEKSIVDELIAKRMKEREQAEKEKQSRRR